MQTITDLFHSLIETSKERIKTPITGAFICSFFAYNWRPFFILLFSDSKIENKIEIISRDYFKDYHYYVGVPFAIALGYTLLVPLFMVGIEKCLTPAKKMRIKTIYDSRIFTTRQKVTLATEITKLRNAESGNKEIEDLLAQIESFREQSNLQQDSLKQINESHNATVEGLNSSLKTSKDSIIAKDLEINRLTKLLNLQRDNAADLTVAVDFEFDKIIKNILDNNPKVSAELVLNASRVAKTLSVKDFMFLQALKLNGKNEILLDASYDFIRLEGLVESGVISRRQVNNKTSYVFSELGSLIYEVLLNEKIEQKNKF